MYELYEMLLNVALVFGITFVVLMSVWACMAITGSVQIDRERHRKQQLQDEQIARAREELTKRYQ